MKKILVIVCITIAVMAAGSLSVFAAEESIDAGIFGFEKSNGFSGTINADFYKGTDVIGTDNAISSTNKKITISDNEITTDIYCGAEKMKITYLPGLNAKNGDQYLIFVRSSNSPAVTSDDIVYINQDGLNGDEISFNVYPSNMVSGKTYYVYLTTNGDDANLADFEPVASFKYYAEYRPGDVNDDGDIDIKDATAVLNHIVENEILSGKKFSAANVVNDNIVDINDATKLLNYIVENIDTLN